jgi:DNA-binding MarR family transcriptional regulator
MVDPRELLFEEFEKLFQIRNECSCRIFSECGFSDMTVRQIAYLRTIDEQEDVTFSRLAEVTNTSKPTITEMVNRFVRMECVYREPCPDDGRIMYIHLTEKGKMLAHAEQAALRRMVERMAEALDVEELDLLVGVLRKVR